MSPSWVTVTLIVTSRLSSIPSQSVIFGVPVTFPSLFTVKPFTVGAVIVLLSLFGVTTIELVYSLFSIAFSGSPNTTSNGFPAVSVDDWLVKSVVLLVTFAVTGEPSFTLSAGIVTLPFASTAIVGSELVQVPSPVFVTVTVCGVLSSPVYVIVVVPSPVNIGVISTVPFSFGVTVGACGFTLTITSVVSVEPSS